MIRPENTTLIGNIVQFFHDNGVTVSSPTPRFYKTIRGGGLNPGNRIVATPFAYNISEIHEWEGHRTSYYYGKPNVTYTGYFPADAPPFPARQTTDLYNRALEKLNSKIRGDLDLSISLAEAGQTAKMFSAMGNVFKGIRGLGSTKHVANGWLQWQYGWRPLCSDVFQALDEMNRILLNKLDKVKASAIVDHEREESKISQATNLQGCRIKWQTHGLEKVEIGIVLAVPQGSFDLSRWSSLNPLSITYELIPYSFVVDWFYDIGSWLRNLETALLYNSRFVRGYTSSLYRVSGRGTVTSQYNRFGHYVRYADCSFSQKIFDRGRLVSYPLPRAPSLKMDLGSQRLLSAAALLRQFVR